MMQIPPWVQEARKEIRRLNNHISRLEKLSAAGMVDEIDAQEDIMNWTGWRDGLKWCIKMWRGKTTREAVWAGEDGTDENEAFLKEKEKELKEWEKEEREDQ